MVLEKTAEYKAIASWGHNVVAATIFLAAIVSVTGALLTRSTLLIAAMLIMLALYAREFVNIVEKMQLFKHGPNAIQYRFLRSIPLALLCIGCALALVG